MGQRNTTTHIFCPYWKAESKKCLACNGGLFIPLDDHIEFFCKTSDYPQCLQYSMHAKSQQETVPQVETAKDNRRKYHRHPSTHKVTLVKLIQSGEVVSHLSTEASTLDLSQGGMRLNLDKPLEDDAIIQFTFEESLPRVLREGTGQVQWCSKQIDEGGYQAGIAFQSDHLIKTMGLYLGMHQTTVR